MTQLDVRPGTEQVPVPGRSSLRTGLTFVALAGLVVALSVVHATQGTSGIGAGDLAALALGQGDQQTWDVFLGSRLPRLLAGLVVGVGVGVAGALLQSVTRNPLASPDTLAVNAGAFLTVAIVAAFGITPPLFLSGALAFLGGLAGAGVVLAVSGGTSGPARVVLAGSATALALGSVTGLLILLFQEETRSLFVWGSGTLVQLNLDAPARAGIVTLVVVALTMLLTRRLDVLALGDDAASSLGLDARRTRLVAVLLSVLLSAIAVTVAGPIGFIGLCAPVLARLSGRLVPGAHRHRVFLPLSGLIGILVVLLSDVIVRLVPSTSFGNGIPTGVASTLFGAVVLIFVARSYRQSAPVREAPAARPRAASSSRITALTIVVLSLLLAVGVVLGLLAGDGWLLFGDLAHWVQGRAGPFVSFSIDERLPRLLAATLAGGALALAGCATQAVCRNPLAEPGLLGITAGAGVGAVALLSLHEGAAVWQVNLAAVTGAVLAFGIVYGLSWRGGLSSVRLVLVGVGVYAAGEGLIAFLIIATNPWDVQLALTWLSGSTYGRTLGQVVPVALALAVAVPLLARHRRDLDVMALDDDTPRVLGVRLERTRMLILVLCAFLTATAAAAIGIVAFVGLVAPHAARAIVGARHARVLPVSLLLGAVMVGYADVLGRSVIAPHEIPTGLVTALIGTPYFVWLLWRSRTS
ncbi:MAG TPA: iron ABC transporter permease [Nocardioidaceae bacterium]|nr:iron ABC transporter permease [Nocardioidaceae bacterium]